MPSSTPRPHPGLSVWDVGLGHNLILQFLLVCVSCLSVWAPAGGQVLGRPRLAPALCPSDACPFL